MPASVATHRLLLLYVISSSTYNSDHKGPLKTCWCLLGSFTIIQFINNSAYISYIFRIPLALLCLLWVYLHKNRLFGYLSSESYCFFFPPSQNHMFSQLQSHHNQVQICELQWGTQPRKRETSKKPCDLVGNCSVCFINIFVGVFIWGFSCHLGRSVSVYMRGGVHMRVTFSCASHICILYMSPRAKEVIR